MENVRKKLIYSALLILALATISCSASHDSALGLSSNDQFIVNPTPDEALKTAAQAVLTTNCNGCHGPRGLNTRIFDLDGINIDMDALALNSSYVSVGNPGNSYLYNSIFEVSMPGATPVDSFFSDDDDQKAIFDWIADIGIPDPNAGDEEAVDLSKATFEEVERLVLTPSCYSCHATNQPVFTDYDSVLNSMVNTNDVAASSFLTSMQPDANDRMPRGQNALNSDLIQLVEIWIQEGALNN